MAEADARVHLGLSAAEFYERTPRHLYTLWQRYKLLRRAEASNLAILTCWYLNVNRDRNVHPEGFQVEQFMPFPASAYNKASNSAEQMTREQVTALRQWALQNPNVVMKKRDAA